MKIVDSFLFLNFFREFYFHHIKNFTVSHYFKGIYLEDQHLAATFGKWKHVVCEKIPDFNFKRHRTNKKSFCEILIHKNWESSDEDGVNFASIILVRAKIRIASLTRKFMKTYLLTCERSTDSLVIPLPGKSRDVFGILSNI